MSHEIGTIADSASVLGVDKTKGGWVIARLSGSSLIEIAFAHDVETIAQRWPTATAVGIDIPLYLVASGRRQAEDELRELLGPAARSMFTSPTAPALHASSQAEATELNRAHGGPGISAQSFGLFGAIIDARRAIAAQPADRRSLWLETHPETSFVIMAGAGSPPLRPKRSAAGVLERMALLQREFGELARIDAGELPTAVRIDDVLDAVAAAWSARRFVAEAALRFGSGETDDDGWCDLIAI